MKNFLVWLTGLFKPRNPMIEFAKDYQREVQRAENEWNEYIRWIDARGNEFIRWLDAQ